MDFGNRYCQMLLAREVTSLLLLLLMVIVTMQMQLLQKPKTAPAMYLRLPTL